ERKAHGFGSAGYLPAHFAGGIAYSRRYGMQRQIAAKPLGPRTGARRMHIKDRRRKPQGTAAAAARIYARHVFKATTRALPRYDSPFEFLFQVALRLGLGLVVFTGQLPRFFLTDDLGK